MIGSAGTGKSCLLHQFIEGQFKEDSSHTIGVEFGSKIVPVCEATDLGHGGPGEIPVCDQELLQGGGWGPAGL